MADPAWLPVYVGPLVTEEPEYVTSEDGFVLLYFSLPQSNWAPISPPE